MEDINYRLELTICASIHLHFLLCGLKRARPGDMFEARSESWKHRQLDIRSSRGLSRERLANLSTQQKMPATSSRRRRRTHDSSLGPFDPEYIIHSNPNRFCS